MQETQETWVRSLGREDPLEEEMETHSSIVALKIPWTEEPGGLQSMGSQRIRHNWATETTTPLEGCGKTQRKKKRNFSLSPQPTLSTGSILISSSQSVLFF